MNFVVFFEEFTSFGQSPRARSMRAHPGIRDFRGACSSRGWWSNKGGVGVWLVLVPEFTFFACDASVFVGWGGGGVGERSRTSTTRIKTYRSGNLLHAVF